MSHLGLRDEPHFVLEGLDALGRSVINRLHQTAPYQRLFQVGEQEQAEVWRCWLGSIASLSELIRPDHHDLLPERDDVRDLIIVAGDGVWPADAAAISSQVIVVLPESSEQAEDSLFGFLAQWFDLLVKPGIISLTWKDVRAFLTPGLPAYAARATVAGCAQAGEAGERVAEQLDRYIAARTGADWGGLLATITAGDNFGLDAYSAVGEALQPLWADDENFVLATIPHERTDLVVWAMIRSPLKRHTSFRSRTACAGTVLSKDS